MLQNCLNKTAEIFDLTPKNGDKRTVYVSCFLFILSGVVS